MKRTDTERIIQYLDRFGVATLNELVDQFRVTPGFIHNLCKREAYSLAKSPRFIMNGVGRYRFWSTGKLKSTEFVTLLTYASQLRQAYQVTGRIDYKKRSLILMRRAVALSLNLLAEFELMEYRDGVHTFSEEFEKLVNQTCDAVDKAVKYGTPMFPGIGE